MTTLVTRVVGGKAAVYTKPASGDPLAPFNDPGAHLDKVKFHSDLDFYRVHMGPTDVTVTLPAVAGSTRSFAAFPNVTIYGNFVQSDIKLLDHNLGYPPNYQIIWSNAALINGTQVQADDDGDGLKVRYLSHWADASSLYLTSLAAAARTNLAAMSFSCRAVVFKEGAPSGNVVFDFDAGTGRLVLAKGMFDSNQKLLRAQGQAGDSPYDISRGQSMHTRNGRTRVALPNGTVTDEPGYTGSFVPPASFQGVIE